MTAARTRLSEQRLDEVLKDLRLHLPPVTREESEAALLRILDRVARRQREEQEPS